MQNKKPLDLSLNNFSRDSPEQYAKSRFDGNGVALLDLVYCDSIT